MTITDLSKIQRKLIVVTGISASGKSSLAQRLPYEVFSLDNFKVKVYNEYGFTNENERRVLWELAKKEFQATIITSLRNGKEVVVEYPFDFSWQEFFRVTAETYNYKTVIIYCNSRDFDDIWESREKRDSDSSQRDKCLTASAYVKDMLYIPNGKLNDVYKEKKRNQYIDNKYTSILGDYIFNDSDFEL